MRYRQADVAGGTYFFTVNLAEWRRTLLVDYVDLLRTVLREVKTRHPFHIDAMVISPDQLRALWTLLPTGDCDYPMRWMLIKAGFSRCLPTGERRGKSRITKSERGIWQRRYWEHVIRDESDYGKHVDYIHYNLVKHGYVKRAYEWPHSSIHRHIARGVIAPNWGTSDLLDDKGGLGEPTADGTRSSS